MNQFLECFAVIPGSTHLNQINSILPVCSSQGFSFVVAWTYQNVAMAQLNLGSQPDWIATMEPKEKYA